MAALYSPGRARRSRELKLRADLLERNKVESRKTRPCDREEPRALASSRIFRRNPFQWSCQPDTLDHTMAAFTLATAQARFGRVSGAEWRSQVERRIFRRCPALSGRSGRVHTRRVYQNMVDRLTARSSEAEPLGAMSAEIVPLDFLIECLKNQTQGPATLLDRSDRITCPGSRGSAMKGAPTMYHRRIRRRSDTDGIPQRHGFTKREFGGRGFLFTIS